MNTMTAVGAVAFTAALTLAGCATTEPNTNSAPVTATDVAEETPTPSQATPTVDDFTVKLKVTSKQCFGSAGCNVTVEPKIGWDSTGLPTEGTVDLTYKVIGDESGSIIETAELDLAEGTYMSSEIMMSTPSSGVTPMAKITEVEYNNL